MFYRETMLIGGIETYAYKAIKNLKKDGDLVVWAKEPKSPIDDSFKNEIYDGKTVIMNGLNAKKFKELIADGSAEIKIITFDMFYFAKAEKFKRNFKLCPVHNFYLVPHFEGDTLYIQDGFSGKKKEIVRKRVEQIVQKMHKNNSIKYFSTKHIERMTSDYSYSVDNASFALVPSVENTKTQFDRQNCERLYNQEIFNILTVSRFEFPHKGYILGLIKTFAELKPKYPQLELTIVGYGLGEKEIKEQISQLDESISNSIHLPGKASPEQLIEYFDNANLNISVAGCCVQGAKNGTLSIPARHYTYDCEVYGYLPQSKSYTVSEEQGEPAAKYIEEILNMSLEEYCDKCKDSFDTYQNAQLNLRCKFSDMENVSKESVLTKKDIKYLARKSRQQKFRMYKAVFSKEGLLKPIIRKIRKIIKKQA